MHRHQSRRRIRLSSIDPLQTSASKRAAQTSQRVKRSSSKRAHMATTSRRRPPREPPLTLTPSTLWNSLPLSVKIIVLLTGFLTLYYFLFAKHQKYDKNFRRMKEIHKDLEEILRKANESGFMDQNLVEAVLPAIFREADNSSSRPNGTHITSTLNMEHNKTVNDTKSLNFTSSSIQDKKLKKKKKKKKEKPRKKKRKKRKPPKHMSTSKQALSETKTSGKELDSGDISSSNATNPSAANENLTPLETPRPSLNQTSPRETTSSVADAADPTKTSHPNTQRKAKSVASEQAIVTDTIKTNDTVEAKENDSLPSSHSKFPPPFQHFEDTQLSKGSLPILNWNPEAVMNESIPEQIFGLGDRHDHVVMYKPLCLDTNSGEGIIFEGETSCGGFNRTAEWMVQYCSVMQSAVQKEILLKVLPERKSKAWLEENSESIEWVTRVTLLQVLERNCGNIAHFSGRALLLQHMIENLSSYAAPPNDIANVLILPTFHVMKRFLHPENYVHWHKRLLRSLVAPAKLEVGDLGTFLERTQKREKPNEPLVQLLHNFSLANSHFAEKKYVCFKRVLIPGYLKGRFFVNDIEYPSTKPSFQFPVKDAPDIPRDSLRLRERVSALVHQTTEFRTMQKDIIVIDRKGKRRIFDQASKPDIMKAFEQVAKKHGYSFKVITFEKISFDEQYKAVSSASIAVGIHGANLVNTMFMPPLAVLIELFPYGFVHEMYRNGGNAGLKYYSYQMSTGKKFEGPRVYRSPEQCIRLSNKCKVHYRDSVLQVTDQDIENMTKILEEAVAWCDKLPAPSKYSSESARNRRRLLRRLLDHVGRKEKSDR